MKRVPRITKQCPTCNGAFDVTELQASKRRYCSRSCAAKARTGKKNPNWKGGMARRECETCGQVFYAKQKDVRYGHARFCSRRCWGKSRSQQFQGDNGCNWHGGPIQATCEHCGNTYEIDRSRKDTARFCSRRCQHDHIRGANHYWWVGGPEPYPEIWTRQFKRAIRERDNYTCAICGTHESKIVHHIDYCKQDCSPTNLVTLCKSCHSRTNTSRPMWNAALFEYQECRKANIHA